MDSLSTNFRYLRLPPLGRPSPPALATADLLDKLRENDRSFGNVWDCIGLELRASYRLCEDDDAFDLSAQAGSDGALDARRSARRSLQRRALLRPAVEPVLLSWWPALARGSIDIDQARAIASALTGAYTFRPRARMRNRGDETGFVYFADVRQANHWGRYIERSGQYLSDPIDQALYAYAATILCHPLSDGNGRLGRALALGALARIGVLTQPSLPLGPLFNCNSILVERELARLSESGAWRDFFDALRPLLRAAADLSQQLVGRSNANSEALGS